MKKVMVVAAGIMLASVVVQAQDIEKFDPRMALEKAVVTNGVKWIDGRYLPLEGKYFSDVDDFYDRLPSGVTVPGATGIALSRKNT